MRLSIVTSRGKEKILRDLRMRDQEMRYVCYTKCSLRRMRKSYKRKNIQVAISEIFNG